MFGYNGWTVCRYDYGLLFR